MAPNAADTAAAPQRQARRPTRIVPAVPHRFARTQPSARPITPEEPVKETVAPHAPDPQPAVEEEREEQSAAACVQTPLTPASRASAVSSGAVEEPTLASSPAASGDDHVEESLDTRVSEANTQEAAIHDTPSMPPAEPQPAVVNGEPPPSAPCAELPPEFHPVGKPIPQTPTVEGGAEAPFQPPPMNIPVHQHKASVEGLVFGGTVQESPAMPSTPQEMEPDVRVPHHGMTRPPPGFAPPQLAPQLAPPFYPGHSHHPSDPSAPWVFPPYTTVPPPPPDGTYGNGQEYHPHSYPPGAVGYQTPHQGQISPQRAPVAMNGTVTSQSQSPIKSQFGDTKPSSNYGEESHSALYQNGMLSQPAERPYGWLLKFAEYFSHQLGNPELADFVLHVRSGEGPLLSLPVHGIVVAHSPVIAEAIRRSVPLVSRLKDSRRLIDILTSDGFVTSASLHEAVKLLYGAQLPPVQSLLYGLKPYDRDSEASPTFNDARKRMDWSLSYAAAGRVLQIPDMHVCGIELARALLRWDTFDQVIHFGLRAGSSAIRPDGPGAGVGIFDTYAASLLDDALNFIAYHFPVDFKLYTSAPEMKDNPRLPHLAELRQPAHNPRLSKIRFGDAPPEDELKPSYVAQVLSSVLLSLPLPLLDRLFRHPAAANQLGWSGLVKIMRDVVGEREKRRQKALKSKIRPSPDGTVPRPLLENLYREERVETSSERPSGHKLTATRAADQV
ncbi:hypothetical protein BU26DRAFT_435474 [Trematosphaeria pertusa]|uniref:Uncharacterized protein n=1 Tax=Trematosphaeria pertusa TaxID=390896 RepID=A0A6A6I1B6_9PLEO|nr:uncharacterized protein BU26DRAFT_435474 [Trematosphaeria pertusa]KAF2244066.1 hypothetical protein BU26DRAFT_435474 [Trematosphaeria pertusa]